MNVIKPLVFEDPQTYANINASPLDDAAPQPRNRAERRRDQRNRRNERPASQ